VAVIAVAVVLVLVLVLVFVLLVLVFVLVLLVLMLVVAKKATAENLRDSHLLPLPLHLRTLPSETPNVPFR
jgi:hypothetical protein